MKRANAQHVMPHTIVTTQGPSRLGIHAHQALFAEKEWTDQDHMQLSLMVHRLVNVQLGIHAELERLKVTQPMFNAQLVHTMMSQAQKNVSNAHLVPTVMAVHIEITVTLAIIAPSTQILPIQQIAIWVMSVTHITTVKVDLDNNFLVSMELGVIRQDSPLAKYVRKASSVLVELKKYVLTTDTAMELDLSTSLDSFAPMEHMELKSTQILDTDSMVQKIALHVHLENSVQLEESQMTVLQDTYAFRMPTNTLLT